MEFSIIVERDQDSGFVGRVLDFPGCLSQGDMENCTKWWKERGNSPIRNASLFTLINAFLYTINELLSNMIEAIQLYKEVMAE